MAKKCCNEYSFVYIFVSGRLGNEKGFVYRRHTDLFYISPSNNLKLLGTEAIPVSCFKKEYLYLCRKAEVSVHLISSGKFFKLNQHFLRISDIKRSL